MGVSYAPGLLHGWGRGATIAWFYGDVGGKERRRGFGRGEKKKAGKARAGGFRVTSAAAITGSPDGAQGPYRTPDGKLDTGGKKTKDTDTGNTSVTVI